MFDTHVTVVGNVVAEPRSAQTRDGHPVASFRLASTPRRFDRATGEWRDGETMFIGVTCWRALAENVLLSLKKGSAVIVMGKMSIRPYETKDGDRRQSIDIDAIAVGPDLGRAVTVIKRTERGVHPNATALNGDLGQPEEPDESEGPDRASPAHSNDGLSAGLVAEPEWGWSDHAGLADPDGEARVDDEVAPDAAADADPAQSITPEPLAAELAAAGTGAPAASAAVGGGRWRRGA